MDVNIRKTATDTAYVLVGVGVLGFQQAQVKRRDAVAKASSIGQDARGSLSQGTDSIKARATGCAASLGDLGSTVTGTVGSLGSTVTGTVGTTLEAVGTQVKAGASQVKSGASIADPRVWAEPVVGDIKVRVEPVIEQLRTISVPDAVSAIPDQLQKTIEVGKARVQGRRGTPTAVPTAVNGDA
jgi:hypothetical protein